MMQINPNETISDFIDRLEREAKERLALASQIRSMMPSVIGNENTPQQALSGARHTRPLTLADHIAEVLGETPRPMTQPEIRDALRDKGLIKHLKHPTSAIHNAMSRKVGKLFRRGHGFDWMLMGKSYGLPSIEAGAGTKRR